MEKVLKTDSPQEAYDLFPKWVASELIQTAENKRTLQSFEKITRELENLSKESILVSFEKGIEKNEILSYFISRANEIIEDKALVAAGLAEFGNAANWETLRRKLNMQALGSPADIVDAIVELKSSEYDRLAAMLRAKKAYVEGMQQSAKTLENERAHLGLFQWKRKKEIDAELEQISAQIKKAEDEYAESKRQI